MALVYIEVNIDDDLLQEWAINLGMPTMAMVDQNTFDPEEVEKHKERETDDEEKLVRIHDSIVFELHSMLRPVLNQSEVKMGLKEIVQSNMKH